MFLSNYRNVYKSLVNIINKMDQNSIIRIGEKIAALAFVGPEPSKKRTLTSVLECEKDQEVIEPKNSDERKWLQERCSVLDESTNQFCCQEEKLWKHELWKKHVDKNYSTSTGCSDHNNENDHSLQFDE